MNSESMMTEEFKSKLLLAQSAEEVAGLLKNVGMDESKVGQIWNEISSHRAEKELSLDELEAVSGGDRNAATEGCAATVEAGSQCVFTDLCALVFSLYDVYPIEGTCAQCGGAPVYADEVRRNYFCSRCGCRMDRNGNPIQVAKQGEFPDFKF